MLASTVHVSRSAVAKSLVWDDLTVAVPLYSRPVELRQLLESICAMEILPGEVLLCEDCSPERLLLATIASEWQAVLAARGCRLRYCENVTNMGYDGNVRNLVSQSTTRWTMLLGNDDLMMPGAIPMIRRFLERNPNIRMVSRSFVRFSLAMEHVSGITRLSNYDTVYTKSNSQAGMILRLCGFVGGLLVDRAWATALATERYDGTLFYQIFLAAEAFSVSGIGYIADPTVGSRTGNPPMFGSAPSERGIHKPGIYSPKARAAMWEGILRICADVERERAVPIVDSVRRELAGRQSFHVFEKITVQGRSSTLALAREFRRLGLMGHPLPLALTTIGLLLGTRSSVFFEVVRAAQKYMTRIRTLATFERPSQSKAGE